MHDASDIGWRLCGDEECEICVGRAQREAWEECEAVDRARGVDL